MEFPSKELLNYGVAVAILVPVLGFFLWAGRAIVRSLLHQAEIFIAGLVKEQEAFATALKEITAHLVGIRENCQACRSDSMARLHEAGEAIGNSVGLALANQAARFETALTSAAQSIRASNERLVQEAENRRLRHENEELSRPHDITVGATPQPIGRR